VPYYTIISKLTEGALEKELVAVLKKVQFIEYLAVIWIWGCQWKWC